MPVFVDSNIPMYLVGAEHRNKERSRQLLEIAIAARERLVTDVETFQEILHRYVAIERRDAIEPAWNALRRVVDEIYPIELEDAERARDLVLTSRLGARDSLHVAVMQRHGIVDILTFDAAFDTVPGIRRRS